MTEAEDEISDDAMPQLPASVHVRKSSVTCSKVRAACSSSARHPQLKRPASKQEHHACPHGAPSTIVVCMPGCPASNNHAALLTTATTRCTAVVCVQNNELVEMLQERVRELEAEAEEGRQQLADTEQQLKDTETANK